MAGVYVHIPFCKSRCKYCDFFSTTQLERRDAYVQAVLQEMDRRLAYLPEDEKISTIYMGGGTPSMLENRQVAALLNGIRSRWHVAADAEITLEANPGDISAEKVQEWHDIGVNRLSIGIQSFSDELLARIGRRHTAAEALQAVRTAQEAGYDNISVDLMYGLPGQTEDDWRKDVEQALALDIQHISAYGLMYEEGTALTGMLHRGEIEEADEELSNRMYDYLGERLERAGFGHYEVSNYALAGCESKHNSSYWNGTPYLGLGAGAHSFDGLSRQWNVADLESYIDAMTHGEECFEEEILSEDDKYNELVMLSLRTRNGLNTRDVAQAYQAQLSAAESFVKSGLLRREGTRLIATRAGLHVLNRIIEELMI